jgi:predicted DNA-binding protein with PD1-like motif
MHMTVSDKDGVCYGGHVLDGCLVETTAEVVLGRLDNLVFERSIDPKTGYLELQVKPKL